MRSHRPIFDLTERLERIIADMCGRLPELAHVNPRRVLVCAARARGSSAGGTFAKVVPTRFPDGSPLKQVDGKCFALPQIPTAEGDVLYLIYVYVPRFFAQPFDRRLLTLVHELYHIAPAFDGTIRRRGRCLHGASRLRFNAGLQPLVDAYLATSPPEELLAMLREDFTALSRRALLVGRRLPLPKAIRVR